MDAAIEALAESEALILAAIEGRDLALVAHAESGWSVKDVIGHVAAWNDQAARSLEAHRAGTEYRVDFGPGEDDLNHRLREQHAGLAASETVAWWRATHVRLVDLARALRAAGEEGPLMFPWGARGTVVALLHDMAGHEREHLATIRAAFANG